MAKRRYDAEEEIYYFIRLYAATGLVCHRWSEESGLEGGADEFDPVRSHPPLLETLLDGTRRQKLPCLWQDVHGVLFAGIQARGACYLLGPAVSGPLDVVTLHRYYFDYGMKRGMEKQIPVLSFTRFLAVVQLVYFYLTGERTEDQEILAANGHGTFQGEAEKVRQGRYSLQGEEDALQHHTYHEERELLDAIREGRAETAVKMAMVLDEEAGRLSDNELKHWERLAVSCVTLGTRAAVDGGVSPTEAYETSDYYLRALDGADTIPAVIALRNSALADFAGRVQRRQEHFRSSSYVEQCCDYVAKHYREKISLPEIAGRLGISAPYLSRLFSEEKGASLREYIVKVRVEKAKNLLMYADQSMQTIGEYVGFPSQSYFCRMFRKVTGMTPRSFREKHKPKEFLQETNHPGMQILS